RRRGRLHATRTSVGGVTEGQVAWRVVLAIRPGRLDRFGALTGEMVEATRAEPGPLSYQRFGTPAGATAHAVERYAYSDAALADLRLFERRFAERFTPMIERREFVVFGNPTPELRKALDRLGAQHLQPLGDFGYWASRREAGPAAAHGRS